MSDRMRVAVLFGGDSAERNVSIASGAAVVRALRSRGHDVVAVDTLLGVLLTPADEDRVFADGLSDAPVPCVEKRGHLAYLLDNDAFVGVDLYFLALHGGAGEGGQVQATLDQLGLPYTGSGMLGSAVSMDKDIAKRLMRDAGVPTPEWMMAPVEPEVAAQFLGLPLVVKPSKQGSTVGLTLATRVDHVAAGIDFAFEHDDEVILEAFVPGRELTVPVLNGEALPVGEIIPRHEIFDSACKYQPGMAEEVFPADLDPAIAAAARRLALIVHRTLKLGAYSRIDFRLDPEGQLWCLEANTLPGMTAASLLPKSAAAAGIEFPELCELLCRSALVS